jgi:hypothetical protein
MNGINQNYSRYEGESLTAIARNPSAIKSVFLSSTFEDLKEYIKEVQITIREAGLFCSTESWITAYVPTVDECKSRLDNSDKYLGIFAYWYGSIPQDHDISITHLEFTWAEEKWREASDSIAIMMPEELGESEKCLRENASTLILGRYEQEEVHENYLKAFHSKIGVDDRNRWLMLNRFNNLARLCARVSLICAEWKGITPMEAAQGNVEILENNDFKRTATNEELGSLGRDQQFADLKKIVNKVLDFSEVPAIGFIVSGEKDAGQYEFLQHLIRRKKIRIRPTEIGRPQIEQYDLDSLFQWARGSLGIAPFDDETNVLEKLAEAIHNELQEESLCLILDEIHRYSGGVASFYETFWSPLYAELEKLQRQNPASNQLLVFIVDYSGKWGKWNGITKIASGNQIKQSDYRKMFLLKLESFTRVDILNWFDEIDISGNNARRKYLLDVALNDINNQDDGTPQEVFRKLRKENLWNE